VERDQQRGRPGGQASPLLAGGRVRRGVLLRKKNPLARARKIQRCGWSAVARGSMNRRLGWNWGTQHTGRAERLRRLAGVPGRSSYSDDGMDLGGVAWLRAWIRGCGPKTR